MLNQHNSFNVQCYKIFNVYTFVMCTHCVNYIDTSEIVVINNKQNLHYKVGDYFYTSLNMKGTLWVMFHNDILVILSQINLLSIAYITNCLLPGLHTIKIMFSLINTINTTTTVTWCFCNVTQFFICPNFKVQILT